MSEQSVPSFDPAEVRRWYDDDLESIQELIGLVITDLPKYAAGLEAAADSGDLATVARFGHTIKGAVGNVCARQLGPAAEALELAARHGDAARVDALRPEFRRCVGALIDELGAWVETISQSPASRASGGPA